MHVRAIEVRNGGWSFAAPREPARFGAREVNSRCEDVGRCIPDSPAPIGDDLAPEPVEVAVDRGGERDRERDESEGEARSLRVWPSLIITFGPRCRPALGVFPAGP
ncbi:hypothetical protein [Streptomyces vinaceus]|uniref:hypothetical protein n=1 Tax=Streptomyces vinaceus TaxID=1960 RepID=UPI003678EFB6